MLKRQSTTIATGLIIVSLLLVPAIAYINHTLTGGYGIANQQTDVINFDWQDIHGNWHSFNDWDQGPSYVFLGFLNCSEICPIRTQQMLSLMAKLDKQQQANTRFLFITIDPLFDTADIRTQKIDSLSPQFFSAELSTAQLDILQSQLAEISSKNYDINQHTGNLYLFSAKGRLVRSYTHKQLSSEKLLAEVNALTSRS